jgi:hypothetical protein
MITADEGLRGRLKPEDPGGIRCSLSFYPVKVFRLCTFGVRLDLLLFSAN